MRRRDFAGLAFIGAFMPFIAFYLSGMKPFQTYWEFASYRYFEAMSYFEPIAASFWTVQGLPMALLQVPLFVPFILFGYSDLGNPQQIALFSYLSLLMAYALIGLALAYCFLDRRVQTIDAIAITLATFLIFPMTRWYPYWFASDYWIFEVPLAIVSAAWATTVVRAPDDTPLPDVRTVIAAGAWAAVCFTQKPSLAGLGLFPILYLLALSRGAIVDKIWRIGIIALSFAVAHSLIMFALNKFSIGLTTAAMSRYWTWIAGSSSSGTSLLSLRPLLVASGYLPVTIAVGGLVTASLMVISFLEGRRRQSVIATILLGGIFLGHVMVIRQRPSGTSVIDTAIFGAMLVPIALAMGKMEYRRYYAAAALAVLSCLVYAPALLPPKQPPNTIINKMAEASAYARSLKRPIRVIVHDNRAHPLIIQALALYTGQLPPLRPGKISFRDVFIPNTELFGDPNGLQAIIDAGDVIIWGSGPTAPKAEEAFPGLVAFEADPRAVIRVFEIEPGATGHTAYIGYKP